MDKDNEIELVQTIQEKDKKIKELEEKVKELEYMYKNTKRELITRTNKYIELLEKLKDSVPKEKIREYIKEKEEEKEGVKNISLEEYAITSKELKESEICLLKCLLEEE